MAAFPDDSSPGAGRGGVGPRDATSPLPARSRHPATASSAGWDAPVLDDGDERGVRGCVGLFAGQARPKIQRTDLAVFLKLERCRWWVGLWSDSWGSAWLEIPNETVICVGFINASGDALNFWEPRDKLRGNLSTLGNPLGLAIQNGYVLEGSCKRVEHSVPTIHSSRPINCFAIDVASWLKLFVAKQLYLSHITISRHETVSDRHTACCQSAEQRPKPLGKSISRYVC